MQTLNRKLLLATAITLALGSSTTGTNPQGAQQACGCCVYVHVHVHVCACGAQYAGDAA